MDKEAVRESGKVDKWFGELVGVEETLIEGDGRGEFGTEWQTACLQRRRFGVGKEAFPNKGRFSGVFLKQKEQLQFLSCP
jgi:hypothetical protein